MDNEGRKALRYSEDWLPEREIEALVCERTVEPDMTDEEQARRILSRAAPVAARSIVHLATHSGNESVRLRAAQYVVDGIVGGTFKAVGGEDDVLMTLVAQLAANDVAPTTKVF